MLDAQGQQIINVAAGIDYTDAVNVGQLRQAIMEIAPEQNFIMVNPQYHFDRTVAFLSLNLDNQTLINDNGVLKVNPDAISDGSQMPADVLQNVKKLAENLQVLRDFLGKKITINSGYRSAKYNATIKNASPKSQHILGKAADIVVQGMPPKKVAETLEKLINEGKIQQGGIGIYDNFTHYDIRGVRARWNFSNKSN